MHLKGIRMETKKDIRSTGSDERTGGTEAPHLEMADNVAPALRHPVGLGNQHRMPQRHSGLGKEPRHKEHPLPPNPTYDDLLHCHLVSQPTLTSLLLFTRYSSLIHSLLITHHSLLITHH